MWNEHSQLFFPPQTLLVNSESHWALQRRLEGMKWRRILERSCKMHQWDPAKVLRMEINQQRTKSSINFNQVYLKIVYRIQTNRENASTRLVVIIKDTNRSSGMHFQTWSPASVWEHLIPNPTSSRSLLHSACIIYDVWRQLEEVTCLRCSLNMRCHWKGTEWAFFYGSVQVDRVEVTQFWAVIVTKGRMRARSDEENGMAEQENTYVHLFMKLVFPTRLLSHFLFPSCPDAT